MANLKHDGPAERELLEALAHTIEEEPGSTDFSKCPSSPELRQLARGACTSATRRAELLVHLADCNHCIQIMKHIRESRVFRQRALAMASVLVVAATIWMWSPHYSGEPRNRVTTVDLRVTSYTRGDESPPTPQPAKVGRPIAHFRIILPLGGDGAYEAAIVPAGSNQTILAHASGNTQIEDGGVVLYLSADVSALSSGNYSLALRRSSHEWEYYPLNVE